jgi:hypothetical protein
LVAGGVEVIEQLRDRVEQSIRDACFAIAADWAASLHGRRVTPGTGYVRGTKEPPPPVALSTLDDRAECCARLAGWALVVIDERELHPKLDGLDAVMLARFVDTHAGWFAEHPAGLDVARELADSARKIERLARPERRDYVVIGECPRTVASAEGEQVVCGRLVRAYPEKNIIKCPGCGHEDTLAWWESVIVPNLEDKPLLTVGELVMVLHRRTGRQIPEGTIRQWASTGHIRRHGKDKRGRTLYDRVAVVAYVEDGAKETAA